MRAGTRVRAALRTIFVTYRQRAVLGFVLLVSQAFFYNAIFFSYGLILVAYYAIPSDRIGLYLLPFAIGNFLGPLLLGRLFDTIGRKPMIAFTYAISGLLLAATAMLFDRGLLDATTQTIAWMVIFFFASAAASSAYLTVSESFPLEVARSPSPSFTCSAPASAASLAHGCSACWWRAAHAPASSGVTSWGPV